MDTAGVVQTLLASQQVAASQQQRVAATQLVEQVGSEPPSHLRCRHQQADPSYLGLPGLHTIAGFLGREAIT